MANFIAIPAADIESFLQKKGFTRFKASSGAFQTNEIVYHKRSTVNQGLMIKVYTSIREGQSSVRPAGKDAIRVCCVFDDGHRSFGVGKFDHVMRVHSVQSTLERLEERLKEATARAKEWLVEKGYSAPAPAPVPTIEQVDMVMKNIRADLERKQEQAAYMAEMEREAALVQREPTFEEYAQTLVVPF